MAVSPSPTPLFITPVTDGDGDGFTTADGDCDDDSETVYPGADEVCDGRDNDCDGRIDEDLVFYQFFDGDKDGFGDPDAMAIGCSELDGFSLLTGDCDDNDPAVYPGADEVCDGKDQDCDGDIDEGVTLWFYQDEDGDGHGGTAESLLACTPSSGYVDSDDDCDDGNPSVYPGADEQCDGLDDDCDGIIDNGLETTVWYQDEDGDGYGGTTTVDACAAPPGFLGLDGDCNDQDESVYPGAFDAFNDGVDGNCNGYEDEIYLLAGKGASSTTGDGGSALSATLNRPNGLVLAPDGALYVSEENGNVVRRILPDGLIGTVAGTGAAGDKGDGGPAIEARLNSPCGMVLDTFGRLYIADRDNNKIRVVEPSGVIETFAGTGKVGHSGDGGYATEAEFDEPVGLVMNLAGFLYVADKDNDRIRRIDPSGVVTLVAGTTRGYSGDGGPAVNAQLNKPRGLALAPDGTLYIADSGNNCIRAIDKDGIIHTVAGVAGSGGFGGDEGDATAALFREPSGIAFDAWGQLYIADKKNQRIRKIRQDGTIITVAGTGTARYDGDGGFSGDASLDGPRGVVCTPQGDLIITDKDNNRVRRVFW